MSEQDPEVLAEIDTDPEAGQDHPDGVSDAEAEAGHEVYLAVDDTDDDSTGLAP